MIPDSAFNIEDRRSLILCRGVARSAFSPYFWPRGEKAEEEGWRGPGWILQYMRRLGLLMLFGGVLFDGRFPLE